MESPHLPEEMLTMQYVRYGSPDQLRTTLSKVPKPCRKQVLIRVHATSVNPIDWKLRTGDYKWIFPQKFPVTPGSDVAGEVVAVGRGVKDFCVGQRVFARLDSLCRGAAGEFCICGTEALAPMPETMEYEEAAGLPLAGMTALQALRDNGELTAGQRVLVVGASGGVGHYGVQIAKILGAHVTAVCSGRNVELVRSLGADEVIDYTQTEDFGAGTPYDVVFDCVGNLSFGEVRPWLTERGIFVTCLPRPSFFFQGLWLWLTSKQRLRPIILDPTRADLTQLGQWHREGRLRTHIHQLLPLTELAQAHELSQTGRVVGKLVLTVEDEEEDEEELQTPFPQPPPK